jgi:hypothetical protein
MKKLIKNYTTNISIEVTISEIQKLLSENGATSIMTEYDNGKIKSLFFKLRYGEKELPFRLPVKRDNVFKALFSKLSGNSNPKWFEERQRKAGMIAWRVCKLWLEAQITHINLEQAKPEEVFLPYLVMGNNKTLFEQMEENQFLLPSGS